MTDPKWLALARAEIGTKEIPGPRHNPNVVAYFAEAQHPEVKADEVPWCAAFVGAMLKRAGIKPSGSLAARSYERWGQPLKTPVLGAVATKKRGNSSWQGHVGFVVAADKNFVWLLGGNQNDQVNIARFKRSEFTSYRWPANIEVVKAPLPTSAGGNTGVKES